MAADAPGYAQQPGIRALSIFEKVDDIPDVPVGEDGEPGPAPEAPENGWPQKWKNPFTHVSECVRDQTIHYFRTPKLGSYVAIPFEYNYEVDTMEEGPGPEIEAGVCPPFPTYDTSTKSAQGALAFDTLGTDGEFKECDCECGLAWTKKLGEGLARIANE